MGYIPPKECKTCKGWVSLLESCIHKTPSMTPEEQMTICPCKNCLIKTMCEDDCQEFIDHKAVHHQVPAYIYYKYMSAQPS
jgi:hypothetical protein